MNNILTTLKSEQVIQLMQEGKRLDGRKLDEYRSISIKKDISENAEGSAWVKLGETEIIAGVKLVPGDPYPDTPDEGTISIGAELLPMGSPYFESGPPREDAIELARVVDRGIRESKSIDFKKLCITEGEKVWIAFGDIYVINDAGNLFDASSIALVSSYLNAKMPKFEDGAVVKGEYVGKLKLANIPVLCTSSKIGSKILIDATSEEDVASTARFSLASIENDILTACQKGKNGYFTAKELDDIVEMTIKKGKDIRKLLQR
ncbi:MAG: exosome complex protein Rrp42 [Candidatus Diapherotrites archaeon]